MNPSEVRIRCIVVCSVALLGLAASSVAMADKDDLITTATTAGTTAYIVGKNVDGDDLARAHDFADTQRVALQREAATGEGENIDSLASLLGEKDSRAFGRWMQAHYAQLYPEGSASPHNPNLADRIVAMR